MNDFFRYAAPEMFLAEGHYDASVDIYSFGISVCEMHSACQPYWDSKKGEPVLDPSKVIEGIRPKFSNA